MDHLGELRALIARHAGAPALSRALPAIWLRHATAPTPPCNAVFDLAFALVVQGAKRAAVGDRFFAYGAGDVLVVSVELPIVAQIVRASRAAPYLAFAMALRPATIASLVLEREVGAGKGGGGDGASASELGIAVSRATPALLDPIVRMVRLYEERGDAAVLGPMLEREIVWRLLQSEQGARVRQLGAADSGLAKISRAITWIRAHFAEHISVAQAARVAGMSPATFYRHFRAATALSPLQYQKQIRLQDARARLIADHDDIASVGFAVGYESPSQFSREYARLFGVPPGQDVRRLRARPAPEPAI